MAFIKCFTILLLTCCLAALVAAEVWDPPESGAGRMLPRFQRSPQHGSVVITASKDQNGREAGLQYNHNLYTSSNGRGSIDAYAQGSRNFDHNRNDFGGGIQGRWRF